MAFSLSHAEHLAMIAVAQAGPIGIDVEEVRAVRLDPDRLARMIAAGTGLAGGGSRADEPAAAAAITAWVRIEAFAKARGTGAWAALGELGVARRAGRPVGRAVASAGAGDTWITAEARRLAERDRLAVIDLDITRDAPGFRAAVAVPLERGAAEGTGRAAPCLAPRLADFASLVAAAEDGSPLTGR